MPSAAEQEAIDAAKRTFVKWFRCQSGAAIISCFFLVVLQPIVLTPLSCIAVCGMSAFTCAAGYYTARCKDNELDVMRAAGVARAPPRGRAAAAAEPPPSRRPRRRYQLYAFMVTALIFVLVQTVMLPCFKAFYDHSPRRRVRRAARRRRASVPRRPGGLPPHGQLRHRDLREHGLRHDLHQGDDGREHLRRDRPPAQEEEGVAARPDGLSCVVGRGLFLGLT